MKHAALAVVTAACALVTLALCAPLYLTHQGFPLDDAWIHAVYARELARSGLLAFNPGIAATGESSPLWAAVLAGLHAAAAPETAVLLTKVTGFLFHAVAVGLIAVGIAKAEIDKPSLAWVCASLAALHPDLVAGSVSGMEVPLATVLLAGVVTASLRSTAPLIGMLGAACFLGRPESAVVAVLFPLLFWGRHAPRTALRLSLTAAGGVLVAVAATASYNLAVWGRPLPSTFYAKSGLASPMVLEWQFFGFRAVLGALPLTAPLVLLAGVSIALVLAASRATAAAGRMGAALLLSGVAYAVVSFALVHPVDPVVFYHQRYVLPALVLIAPALPLLAWEVTRTIQFRGRALVDGAVVAALFLVLVLASPARYRRLQNDTQNVDDVQVAMGRALAGAPPSANAWVVDVGAARFFGRAFVVDVIGLNSPEMLTGDAQAFLDRHPPAFFDVFTGWSELEADASFETRTFTTSTRYTVTGIQSMRQHSLVSCPPGASGRFVARRRAFAFRCAS